MNIKSQALDVPQPAHYRGTLPGGRHCKLCPHLIVLAQGVNVLVQKKPCDLANFITVYEGLLIHPIMLQCLAGDEPRV